MTVADFLFNSSLNLAVGLLDTPLLLDLLGIKKYCFFCTVFLDGHLTGVVLTLSLLHLIIVVPLVMSNF